MSLTFVVGSAADVFPAELAQAIAGELRKRDPSMERDGEEPYHSEPVNARGWRHLQERVLQTLEYAPQLTAVDAYQAVYVPAVREGVEHVPVGTLADPVQIGSLSALIEELHQFAARASLPTDDLELMGLAAQFLEADEEQDIDVQTYVQLMLSAKQAAARNQPLWVVV